MEIYNNFFVQDHHLYLKSESANKIKSILKSEKEGKEVLNTFIENQKENYDSRSLCLIDLTFDIILGTKFNKIKAIKIGNYDCKENERLNKCLNTTTKILDEITDIFLEQKY